MTADATTLAMFPGQGSQSVGMGKALVESYPYVQEYFDKANKVLGFDLQNLCFEGPEEDLKLTANTQPSILTVSVATYAVLKKEAAFTPGFFAGHSLGEYSALVAAGMIDFERAVQLVRRRGEAMQEAVPAGVGAMAAIMNVSAEDLTKLCAQASGGDQSVEVANFNSPQQIVVAGHAGPVDKLIELAEAAGGRAVKLPVSAPFHSQLMRPAREVMTPLLADTPITPHGEEGAKVIPNVTGKVTDSYISDLLLQQIDSPVRWTQTLENAHQAGCRNYIEVGPGKVLFGLARRGLPRGEAKLQHSEDMGSLIQTLQS